MDMDTQVNITKLRRILLEENRLDGGNKAVTTSTACQETAQEPCDVEFADVLSRYVRAFCEYVICLG